MFSVDDKLFETIYSSQPLENKLKIIASLEYSEVKRAYNIGLFKTDDELLEAFTINPGIKIDSVSRTRLLSAFKNDTAKFIGLLQFDLDRDIVDILFSYLKQYKDTKMKVYTNHLYLPSNCSKKLIESELLTDEQYHIMVRSYDAGSYYNRIKKVYKDFKLDLDDLKCIIFNAREITKSLESIIKDLTIKDIVTMICSIKKEFVPIFINKFLYSCNSRLSVMKFCKDIHQCFESGDLSCLEEHIEWGDITVKQLQKIGIEINNTKSILMQI